MAANKSRKKEPRLLPRLLGFKSNSFSLPDYGLAVPAATTMETTAVPNSITASITAIIAVTPVETDSDPEAHGRIPIAGIVIIVIRIIVNAGGRSRAINHGRGCR